MTKTILSVLMGVTCALALTAGAARASDERSTIVFTVHNIGEATCPGSLFGVSFDLRSPAGRPLGSGVSCVHSFERGCAFTAGCTDRLGATFTLDFHRGSLTAPVVLSELWLSDATVVQRTEGTVTSGTGAFEGARGSVRCAGAIAFTAGPPLPLLICSVHLAGEGIRR